MRVVYLYFLSSMLGREAVESPISVLHLINYTKKSKRVGQVTAQQRGSKGNVFSRDYLSVHSGEGGSPPCTSPQNKLILKHSETETWFPWLYPMKTIYSENIYPNKLNSACDSCSVPIV